MALTRESLLTAVLGPPREDAEDGDPRGPTTSEAIGRLAAILDARAAYAARAVATMPGFPTPTQFDQAREAGTERAGDLLAVHGETAVDMVLRYLGATGRASCPRSVAVTASLTLVAWMDENVRMTRPESVRRGLWPLRSSGAAAVLAPYRRPYVGSAGS